MTNFNNPVDPEAKKDIKNALNAFDRAAKKAASKLVSSGAYSHNMLNEQQVHVNQINHPYNSHNMLNETYGVPQQHSFHQANNFTSFPSTNANGKTRFSVVNMATQQKLAENLHMAESADAIAKLLNGGHSFYSPQVKTILEFEQSYLKHYNDALTFQKRVKSSDGRDAILETRFQEAKRNAISVKEKLVNYTRML